MKHEIKETKEIVEVKAKNLLNDEDQKMISERQIATKCSPEIIDYFDLQAEIEIALDHNLAQRVYKLDYEKINELAPQNCKCCNLLIPKENVVELFPVFGDVSEFSEIALSVTMYLYFIRLAIISLVILIAMNSGIKLYYSQTNFQTATNYCNNNKINPNCSNFNSKNTDFLSQTCYKNYEFIYNQIKLKNGLPITIDFFDYSFISFLCMIVIAIINYLFLIILNNHIIELKIQKISPSNFTLMAYNLPSKFGSIEELKKEFNLVYIFNS